MDAFREEKSAFFSFFFSWKRKVQLWFRSRFSQHFRGESRWSWRESLAGFERRMKGLWRRKEKTRLRGEKRISMLEGGLERILKGDIERCFGRTKAGLWEIFWPQVWWYWDREIRRNSSHIWKKIQAMFWKRLKSFSEGF